MEARKGEYPETIAFIRLLNSLISAALLRDSSVPQRYGGSGTAVGAADGGAELGHFTQFVVTHVLGHLWQREYK